MNGEHFISGLFWLLALTTCGGAIAVVLSHNVGRIAFWLVFWPGSGGGVGFGCA